LDNQSQNRADAPCQCVYFHNFTMHVNKIQTNPEAHCTLQSIMYSRSYST